MISNKELPRLRGANAERCAYAERRRTSIYPSLMSFTTDADEDIRSALRTAIDPEFWMEVVTGRDALAFHSISRHIAAQRAEKDGVMPSVHSAAE